MQTLFDTERMQMTDSIRLTAESLRAHGATYDDWVFAWSGGKDSTCLTLCLYLIESGQVPRPKTITVLYADTRQEILPLWHCAAEIRAELSDRGIDSRVVLPPLDKRMWVYILGRGVPPPNNNTLRYCTRQIKIEPMATEVRKLAESRGGKVLVITGVRLGESAARDSRIALSCSTNGAECGQGYFQESLKGAAANTLASIVHWRVCHVWEWLNIYEDLRLPANRLRKPGGERRKDGSLCSNQQRMGPLTMAARLDALDRLIAIQAEVNDSADRLKRPRVDHLDAEEEARIRELIAGGQWPDGWSGDEPTADLLMADHYADGSVQELLFSADAFQ